jgi:hypothetical protein
MAMERHTTQIVKPSTPRAVIEWRSGLSNKPVIYAIADTAEESALVEKLLAERLGDHDDVAR